VCLVACAVAWTILTTAGGLDTLEYLMALISDTGFRLILSLMLRQIKVNSRIKNLW